VLGDRIRLLEVFQDLIENAVKFRSGQRDPLVEVGSRPGPDGPVVTVRDNGVGIDPRYYDRVFALFERLDPRVEGTGVGLALVKRIVEVHGGRVWVESEGAGQGSTFCFSLPVAPSGGSIRPTHGLARRPRGATSHRTRLRRDDVAKIDWRYNRPG